MLLALFDYSNKDNRPNNLLLVLDLLGQLDQYRQFQLVL
jgi:hypothetical protein